MQRLRPLHSGYGMRTDITRVGQWALVAAIALTAVAVLWLALAIRADRPVAYDDIAEHFKYGSIGSEPGVSLLDPVGGVLPPYAVFTALPSICSDRLPGGYASAGLIFEEGQDLPIGVSRRRRIGVDHVGFNCAVCHTGTLRASPDAARQIVLGMPAHQLDLQAVVQFVLDCTLDNRTTADAVRGRLAEEGGPSAFERLLLRAGLVDRLKLQTLDLRNRIAPLLASGVPRWGNGRVDTFNPYKSIQFNWQLDDLPPAELIGASDFPSLWNQAPREGLQLHELRLHGAIGAAHQAEVHLDEPRHRILVGAEVPLRHRRIGRGQRRRVLVNLPDEPPARLGQRVHEPPREEARRLGDGEAERLARQLRQREQHGAVALLRPPFVEVLAQARQHHVPFIGGFSSRSGSGRSP